MIKSMTGYGGAKGSAEGLSLSIELKSVNNRYLDVSVKLPRSFLFAEELIKAAVGRHISRGKVDVFVSVDSSASDDMVVRVNEPLLRGYMDALGAVAEKYGLENDMTLMSVCRLPEVLSTDRRELDNSALAEGLSAILEQAPSERRSLLFSATLPKEVERIAKSYMKDPEIVTVGERNAGSDNVEHFYYMVKEEDRYAAMKRIADYNPDIYAIVFCKTREETQKVADMLQRDGYDADSLHGDLSQAQRDNVMGRFKRKALHLLVATDVAARGIDVSDLTHVINYNLPQEIELYTHRSGRTGRAAKKGVSIAIINQREKGKIKRIEAVIKKQFTRLPVPGAHEICERQLAHLINEINNAEVREDIYAFMPTIEEMWGALSKEELVKKMLSYEFNRFFDYYRKAKDINIPEKEKKAGQNEKKAKKAAEPGQEKKDRKGRDGDPGVCEKGFVWLRINLGYKSKVIPRDIISIMKACGIGKKSVGKIEIFNDYLYVGLKDSVAEYARSQINGASYGRKRLSAVLIKG